MHVNDKSHICNNNKRILNQNIHFQNSKYISNKSFNPTLEQNARQIFLFPLIKDYGFSKLIRFSAMV